MGKHIPPWCCRIIKTYIQGGQSSVDIISSPFPATHPHSISLAWEKRKDWSLCFWNGAHQQEKHNIVRGISSDLPQSFMTRRMRDGAASTSLRATQKGQSASKVCVVAKCHLSDFRTQMGKKVLSLMVAAGISLHFYAASFTPSISSSKWRYTMRIRKQHSQSSMFSFSQLKDWAEWAYIIISFQLEFSFLHVQLTPLNTGIQFKLQTNTYITWYLRRYAIHIWRI